MAKATDGIAVVQTSEMDAALRRIADDLSSYYLIGYSSSEKLDGRFHRITVRVKRPGVNVRARRGYLAANAEAVAAGTTAVGRWHPGVGSDTPVHPRFTCSGRHTVQQARSDDRGIGRRQQPIFASVARSA